MPNSPMRLTGIHQSDRGWDAEAAVSSVGVGTNSGVILGNGLLVGLVSGVGDPDGDDGWGDAVGDWRIVGTGDRGDVTAGAGATRGADVDSTVGSTVGSTAGSTVGVGFGVVNSV